jgi:hypothetical protein
MGIGNLDVSVSANTSRAIKNLRDFGGEVRSAGRSVKEMKGAFQGSTIGDWESRFGSQKFGQKVKQQMMEMNDGVVDLRGELGRYSSAALKSEMATGGLLQSLKVAGRVVSTFGKATAIVAVGSELVGLGVKLYMNEGQWTKWGTSVGRWLGFVAAEGERADEKLGAMLDNRIAALDKMRAKEDEARTAAKQAADERKRSFQQEMDRLAEQNIMQTGRQVDKDAFLFNRDRQRYGLDEAIALEKRRKENAAQEREHEQWMQEKQDEREAREKAIADREKKRQDDEDRRNKRNLKDAEALDSLRRKVAEFGKSDAEKREMETLSGISDPSKRREASLLLGRLSGMERVRDRIEGLKRDRATLTSGRDNDPLDARSMEGWKWSHRGASVADAAAKKTDQMINILEGQLHIMERDATPAAFDPFAAN